MVIIKDGKKYYTIEETSKILGERIKKRAKKFAKKVVSKVQKNNNSIKEEATYV